MSGEGDVFFKSRLIDFCVKCLIEVLFAGVGLADEEPVDGEAFFFEGGNDLEEVEGAFPSGDATGQGDDKFVFGFGKFFLPLSEPIFGGLVVGRVGCRVDSAMNDA